MSLSLELKFDPVEQQYREVSDDGQINDCIENCFAFLMEDFDMDVTQFRHRRVPQQLRF